MEQLRFDAEKVRVVPIGKIKPNPWNPKLQDTDEYARVVESIRKKGLRLPIVVRDKGRGYEIVDGEQRWRACKDIGFKQVIIYSEGNLSDKEARELTVWYQQQVPFDEIELAKVVAELAKMGDYELPYTEEEVKEYIDLVNFDWSMYEEEFVDIEEHRSEKKEVIYTDEEGLERIKGMVKEDLEKYSQGSLEVEIRRLWRIGVISEQVEVILGAIEYLQEQEEIKSKGRALELICAEFLSGRV